MSTIFFRLSFVGGLKWVLYFLYPWLGPGHDESLRAWFGRFTKVMMSLQYNQSQEDYTMFIKHSDLGSNTFVSLCRWYYCDQSWWTWTTKIEPMFG